MGASTPPEVPDADYAELIHAASGGTMAPDTAMSLAVKRHQMAPADLAEHLHSNGLAPDSALKYAVVGAAAPEDAEFAQQKAAYIAQHPLLDKFDALGQGLARGVTYGATQNFEGPDEQGVATRNPGLVETGQVIGSVASPITRAIGVGVRGAGALAGGVKGGLAGAIQGFNTARGQGGVDPTLGDRLRAALATSIPSAIGGAVLTPVASAIGNKLTQGGVTQAAKDYAGQAQQEIVDRIAADNPGWSPARAQAAANDPNIAALYGKTPAYAADQAAAQEVANRPTTGAGDLVRRLAQAMTRPSVGTAGNLLASVAPEKLSPAAQALLQQLRAAEGSTLAGIGSNTLTAAGPFLPAAMIAANQGAQQQAPGSR